MIRNTLSIILLLFTEFAIGQLLPLQVTVVEGVLTIDQSANKRYSSIKEALKNPDSVKVLVLQGQHLKKLPKSITKLKNLEELYLGYIQGFGLIETNNFTKFPEEIYELTKLKVLQLNNNQITEIPEEIKKLSSLQTLELFGNPISKFPSILYELPNLENLDLGDTEIKSFPDDIHKLKNLKNLDLSYSKAKKLPDSFGGLTKLEWLDLSMSDLKQLPISLSKCNKIVHLDLFGTNSIDLEETFEILKNIDSLRWIHINEIKYLPENLSEFKALETLNINNDKYHIDYSQVFKVIASIKSLKTLYIDNEFGENWKIPDEIGLCTQLTGLSLYHSNNYYDFTISTEIKNLQNLTTFGYQEYIDNFKKIKKLLPKDCYVF